MLFQYKNELYKIGFEYAGDRTYARLFRVDYDVNNDDKLHFEYTGLFGQGVRKHNDQYRKSTGRKMALKSLIKRMGQVSAGDSKPEFDTNVEFRTILWEIYFTEHKK